MNILEKEIEDLIYNAIGADIRILRQRGLYLCPNSTYVRQMPLGNYGRADIIGINTARKYYKEERIIRVSIIEIKKEEVNTDTLLQAIRYSKGVEEKFELEGIEYPLEFQYILVGKSFDKNSDFIYMADYMPNLSIYTYHLDLIQGISFKSRNGYSLTNKGMTKDGGLSIVLKENARHHFLVKKYHQPEPEF